MVPALIQSTVLLTNRIAVMGDFIPVSWGYSFYLIRRGWRNGAAPLFKPITRIHPSHTIIRLKVKSEGSSAAAGGPFLFPRPHKLMKHLLTSLALLFTLTAAAQDVRKDAIDYELTPRERCICAKDSVKSVKRKHRTKELLDWKTKECADFLFDGKEWVPYYYYLYYSPYIQPRVIIIN